MPSVLLDMFVLNTEMRWFSTGAKTVDCGTCLHAIAVHRQHFVRTARQAMDRVKTFTSRRKMPNSEQKSFGKNALPSSKSTSVHIKKDGISRQRSSSVSSQLQWGRLMEQAERLPLLIISHTTIYIKMSERSGQEVINSRVRRMEIASKSLIFKEHERRPAFVDHPTARLILYGFSHGYLVLIPGL